MKELYNSLSKVVSAEITTFKQLSQHNDLYEEVFLNIDHFITHIALRSHTNVNHLLELSKLGIDPEDVHYDVLERCINKLDLVLKNDLEHMIPYLYTIVNNRVKDTYRKTIKEHNRIISLDETLNRHDGEDDSKRTKTLEDHLADKGISAESFCIAKEEVIAIFKKYSNNCDALLCMIARKVFDNTPRELAEILISQGSVSKTITLYQNELSEIYNISPNEFPAVAPVKENGLSKVLSKGNKGTKPVASKISNILNRVK